jgi:hypothetical protein
LVRAEQHIFGQQGLGDRLVRNTTAAHQKADGHCAGYKKIQAFDLAEHGFYFQEMLYFSAS